MKRKVSIENVDRLVVSKSTKTTPKSKTVDPTKQGDSGTPIPIQKEPTEQKEPKKKGPGTRVMQKDLPDSLIDVIENAIKNPKDWDIGEVVDGGSKGVKDPDGNVIGDFPIPPESGIDERIWNKTPQELERAIDDAIKDGIDESKKEERKEAKTSSEKGMGGGRGGIRDRLMVEALSKTDWASIFKTRLTAYSREATQYLPYHRRFVASKVMRTKIPSRTATKDVLPELNIIIDTSSSLSFKELEVILAEVNKALSEAKINKVNVILWESSPYFFKSYDKINGKNFQKIIDDVQANWRGGGNDMDKVYKLMIEKGITKKFTIHLTDGFIQDHRTGTTLALSQEALDPNNTIFGIIYPYKSITVEYYKNITDMFPGEKIPIFLDTSKFR